nr:hypothetical protein [Mobilicoccus pelagius]
MNIVMVGGVAAGMSAATRLRRLDEHASITVVERGGHVSFANCGLCRATSAVAKCDAIDGEEVLVPLANTTNLQGHRITDTIAGRDVAARPVLGAAVVGVCGLQVVTVGWNERRPSAAARRPYRAIHTHPSHAPGTARVPRGKPSNSWSTPRPTRSAVRRRSAATGRTGASTSSRRRCAAASRRVTSPSSNSPTRRSSTRPRVRATGSCPPFLDGCRTWVAGTSVRP